MSYLKTKAQILKMLAQKTPDEIRQAVETTQAAPSGTYVSHSLATEASDFLVASRAGQFVKRTIAEVKAIFGFGTAAYTAATDYVKHSLATAANDFLVASGSGAFVKKTLAEVKVLLSLGSAAYTDSGDYAVSAKGVTNGDSHDHAGGDGANIAKLAGLTTNGFVKTGSSDGTLSVDTATYVPIAGGTMTGPLHVRVNTGTDGVILEDASGVKKLGIQWTANIVTLDVLSPEPTNQITNSSFETDLSGWSGIDWWLSGGIASAGVLAAYQPKNAASLADSYINLANPGTYDAFAGSAPTWDATNGWKFGVGKYLRTGIVPTTNYSAICLFSNGDGSSAYLFGASTASGKWLISQLSGSSPFAVTYFMGGASSSAVAPGLTSGILAIAGLHGYRGTTLDWTSAGGTIPNVEIHINGYNNNGTNASSRGVYMQAMAIYSVDITSYISSLVASMSLL
jgi:hypothetical protein